jgi:catechol 2,3-dioxygenase-like lactoylglutathione lyase family enzyme
MIMGILRTPLLVKDYEEAIAFYCEKIGFQVTEDTPLEGKRWVRLRAPGNQGSEILVVKAKNERETLAIGNQSAGRVLFYMETDHFDSDYERLRLNGVEFSESPRTESYGKVAVFKDLYGNRIDLIMSLKFPTDFS